MAKVLYSKGREFDHKGKKKVAKKTRKYFVADDKDFHCNEGIISAKDIATGKTEEIRIQHVQGRR